MERSWDVIRRLEGHAKYVIATREDDSGSDGVLCVWVTRRNGRFGECVSVSHDEYITA